MPARAPSVRQRAQGTGTPHKAPALSHFPHTRSDREHTVSYMTHSKEQDPYANPRAFYGAELRRLREDAGLTQAQLGMRAFCSGSYCRDR